MRTLFLHCGPAKTGTSAIQAALRDAAPPGLTYPATGQWPDGAHHLITMALDGRKKRGANAVPPLAEVKAALSEEVQGTGDVLISSEGFVPRRTYPAFLAEFADLVAGFDRVETLVVLRHPLERAASFYNQDVKDPVRALSTHPDAFLSEVGDKFALMRLVREWRKAAPETRFLSYHPAGSLLGRFMDAIGHPRIALPGRPRRNASLGGAALLTLLLQNRIAPDGARLTALMDALRHDTGIQLFGGAHFPFSRDTAQRFLAAARDDLKAARAALGIDLTGLYPEPPPRFFLSEDVAARIRGHLEILNPDDAAQRDIEALLAEFSTPDPTA